MKNETKQEIKEGLIGGLIGGWIVVEMERLHSKHLADYSPEQIKEVVGERK